MRGPLKSSHRRLWGALLVVLALASAGIFRDALLEIAGAALVIDQPSEPSDVVMVVRGDPDYARAIAAGRIYRAGRAKHVYISTALIDLGAPILAEEGIRVPTDQQLQASALRQMGVPEQAILLDDRRPGGGTLGELRRLKAAMAQHNLHSVIAVTDFYHSRRVSSMLERIMRDTDIRATVSVAEPKAAEHWWRRRYLAINVMLEYVKWGIWLIYGESQPSFSDDPAT